MLAELVHDPERAALLLVGSLAEGLATPASDVDLLVLVDSPADLRARVADRAAMTSATVEVRRYAEGFELNPEIAFRSDMRGIVGAFLQLAPLLYQTDAQVTFPRLDAGQVRMLHRLRTGTVWRNAGSVEMWRDELYTALLPPYLVLAGSLDLDRAYEHALAARTHGAASVAAAGRRVGEAALGGGLASVGITNPSPVAAVELAHGVDDARVRPLLDLAIDSMFPDASMDLFAIDVYLGSLETLRDALVARAAELGLDRARASLAAQSPIVTGAPAAVGSGPLDD